MAFIPIPSAIEVAVHWDLAGQDVVMTFGIKVPAGVTLALVQAAADALATWATGRLVTHVSQDLVFDYAHAVDQSSVTGPVADSLINHGTAGAVASDSAPSNAALVITNATALRGRSYRGRNFVPGIPQNKLDTPTDVLTAWVSNVLGVFANVNTETAGFSGVHAVLSRQLNNAPRVVGVATPVSAYIADSHMDSQRRRLFGRGA